MPGPPPKPADQRARRNSDGGTTSTSVEIGALAGGGGMTLADDPEFADLVKPYHRWLKQTREAWEAVWETPEAALLRPQHLPALKRLYHMYDEEERLRRRVAKSRTISRSKPLGMDGPAEDGEVVVDSEVRAERIPGHLGIGSTGQLTQSPDFTALMKVRTEIRLLEDRLGGTPMATFRMGWQHGEMIQSQVRANEAAQIATAARSIAERHEKTLEDG